jgi:RNA polymerase sigma-70 factor (ECF subfamily)
VIEGFAQTTTAGVAQLAPSEDDAALVEGLRRGDAAARRELFDRFAPHVERVLARVLGRDPELSDALHDTFVQAFGSFSSLRDASALKAWLSMVAVYTARGIIRRRKVRRWLRFWAPEDLPETPSHGPSAEDAWAVARVYTLLDRLPADHRIAFTLRFVEGMSLQEVAEACSCSLATVKRRLTRAQTAFRDAAKTDPVLAEWAARSGSPEGGADDADGSSSDEESR